MNEKDTTRSLLRIAVECPGCKGRPALRVTPDALLAMAHVAPDTRIATYKCQRRRCGRVYDITAAHYHAAS